MDTRGLGRTAIRAGCGGWSGALRHPVGSGKTHVPQGGGGRAGRGCRSISVVLGRRRPNVTATEGSQEPTRATVPSPLAAFPSAALPNDHPPASSAAASVGPLAAAPRRRRGARRRPRVAPRRPRAGARRAARPAHPRIGARQRLRPRPGRRRGGRCPPRRARGRARQLRGRGAPRGRRRRRGGRRRRGRRRARLLRAPAGRPRAPGGRRGHRRRVPRAAARQRGRRALAGRPRARGGAARAARGRLARPLRAARGQGVPLQRRRLPRLPRGAEDGRRVGRPDLRARVRARDPRQLRGRGGAPRLGRRAHGRLAAGGRRLPRRGLPCDADRRGGGGRPADLHARGQGAEVRAQGGRPRRAPRLDDRVRPRRRARRRHDRRARARGDGMARRAPPAAGLRDDARAAVGRARGRRQPVRPRPRRERASSAPSCASRPIRAACRWTPCGGSATSPTASTRR